MISQALTGASLGGNIPPYPENRANECSIERCHALFHDKFVFENFLCNKKIRTRPF